MFLLECFTDLDSLFLKVMTSQIQREKIPNIPGVLLGTPSTANFWNVIRPALKDHLKET